MAQQRFLKLLPWVGGINDNLDESMIAPNQLTVADHVVFDSQGSRKKRDGIDHHWDSASNGSTKVLAQCDFWYGNGLNRTQKKVAIMSDGTMYSYSANGTRTSITISGTSWSGTLTSAALLPYGNILLIAVSGSTNVMKFWDGTNNVFDVPNNYNNNCLTRASSGTTRTLVFREAFQGTNGSTVIVTQAGSQSYNGTFTVSSVSTTTVTNDTITYTAGSSLSESATADTALRVGSNNVPKASMLSEHLGRVFCNDKNNPDNLHYSPAYDYTIWNGYGDSGALPLPTGDGDPIGLNGISPTFKQVLFVGKLTKLYRMDGFTPETFNITKISDSIGFAGPDAIAAVEQDDIVFVSQKGIHSMVAVNTYGDFSNNYLSLDRQRTFNTLNKARLPYACVRYWPELNSVAIALSSSSATYNDTLWFFNPSLKSWYTWSDLDCTSLMIANDTDKRRLYLGTSVGRISRTLTGNNYDIDNKGTHTAIPFNITTGRIFPDGDPHRMYSFKAIVLYYKPQGRHTLVVSCKIDNIPLSTDNTKSFSHSTGTDVLGSSFRLGSSTLGYVSVMGPYSQTIDGYGRGIKVEITQNDLNAPAEIQGFEVVFEDAGVSNEVFE